MNIYTPLHLHTMMSNSFTVLDSVNSYSQYIEKAKEYGIKSLCFTEHGNVMSFYNKKLECESNNIKYIHGVECYVTKCLNEKLRDNYHCILIALNYDGVKEINYLMSDKVACNNKDGHFYYAPRIAYDELKNTSENILILTACLASILNSKDLDLKNDFIEYIKKNKHRCFLEIQPHLDLEQLEYNKKLFKLSKEYNIKLVATNDVHYLDNEFKKGRSLLQKSKNIHFENEDNWDLEFKSYNNFVKAFELQNSLPRDIYLEAIENTNLISDMIQDFKMDDCIKYPKLYENSEEVFINKIKEGIINRNIDTEKYKNRINYEFSVIKKIGAIDYLLLEEDIKSWCRNNDIKYGASRGSSSGSVICYLLGITDVDSLKYNLSFERFMNESRISLCDIDSDYEPSKRELVKEYLHNKKGLYCAEIITFNTIQEKGALKDVGRALDIPFEIMNEITNKIDDSEFIAQKKKEYPDLFKYAKMLENVITSIGVHPAGTLVSPIPLEYITSTFTSKTCNYPITQLNMKEVDKLNFVKLDILGLETIEIINDVCKLANINFLTPQNFNIEDINIWNEILKSGVGIFQWETKTAHDYYLKLFSESTINKIKEKNPKLSYLDLFSIGNGAIRPAGESYRNKLSNGIYNDNGSDTINDFFKKTLGNCVFQEDIMLFLNTFCGFAMSESDSVRRGFAKKTGTEKFIPKIIEGFKTHSGLNQEESEKAINIFIKVVEDASDYLFSLNHSQVYSIIGAMCGYLRYYHTLEFITVILEHSKNDKEKTSEILNYMNKFTKIKLKNIEFKKSSSKYSCNKEENIIYKGMNSIKFINSTLSEEINKLKNTNTFYDVLMDIKNNTSCNSRQLDVLIKLDYFSDFGKSKKLNDFVEYFDEYANRKSISKDKISKEIYHIIAQNSTETEKQFQIKNTHNILNTIWDNLQECDYTLKEKIQFQKEYLGYIEYKNVDMPKEYIYIEELDIKYTPKCKAYCLNTGKSMTVKIDKKFYNKNKIEEGDLIAIKSIKKEMKWIKDGDDFKQSGTEIDWKIHDYKKI